MRTTYYFFPGSLGYRFVLSPSYELKIFDAFYEIERKVIFFIHKYLK